MVKPGIAGFPYYLGINSLAEIATRDDRVAVLNILGSESKQVTPTSHCFSGGNVVFGTSPGRRGQVLATPNGDIPVYNNIREGIDDGLTFNTGVVYLPPSGARDGVAELVRVNPDLRKVIIITEKVAVHDAREIRAIGQGFGIDILGANSLGVADSWNRVRLGGALGGDSPDEALIKGSIALFSNSGNFTTTIAQYLATAGWGTTTLISSGKDIYIHYAAPDFSHALKNDARSKAAVIYCEPGGYYERGLDFGKPDRRLCRRALEIAPDTRGRPRRRHGRLGRQGRGQGTLVHGGVRRRRPVHARTARRLRQGRGRHQHRPHPCGADRSHAFERRRAGLCAARHARAQALDGQRRGPASSRAHRAAGRASARALRRPDQGIRRNRSAPPSRART